MKDNTLERVLFLSCVHSYYNVRYSFYRSNGSNFVDFEFMFYAQIIYSNSCT